MKTKINILAAAVFLFLLGWAGTARAATYYIDYANGNDSHAGTATTTAWKLCPGMVGFAGTYTHSAGDHFIFKGGVTWTGGVFPLTLANSGSDASHIDTYTVDPTWYTGASWSQPVFDLEQSINIGIDVTSHSYLTVNNIKVINPSDEPVYYALIRGDGCTYITISNCTLDGVGGAGDTNNLYFRNSDHITITGNYLRGKQVTGNPDCILIRPYSKMSNFLISGNEITSPYGSGGDGIHIGLENGVDGAEDQELNYGPITIESNVFHDMAGKMYISALGGAKNLTIRYNRFYGEEGQGCAIDFDQYGAHRYDSSLYSYQNVLLSYNLFYNISDPVHQWNSVGSIIRVSEDNSLDSANNQIYNNSIVEDGLFAYSNQKGIAFQSCSQKGAGWSIKNNILYGIYTAIEPIDPAQPAKWDYTNATIDNNLFFDNHRNGVVGTNPILADPELVNATTYDLHLLSSSSAIDLSTDWGQTQDFAGNAKQGSAWDIGAYEYVIASASSTGNIDTVHHSAWMENAGWLDFSQGNVTVTDSALTGYAWGENVGWINLNPALGGVHNDGNGNLSGAAWGENIGWIFFGALFGGASIDSSGDFHGYAWGENIGWISFNCANTPNSCGTVNFKVKTFWIPLSATTYTITASAGANGTITPSGTITKNYGDNQSFTIATSTAGYHVADILVDGSSVGTSTLTYTFTNITANHTISATFNINHYNITSSVSGANGTISPSGAAIVGYGATPSYTIATSTVGYHVADILVDGVSVGTGTLPYVFSAVHANHTIVVSFNINHYLITSSAGSHGTISPLGATVTSYGATPAYTFATTTAGYHVNQVLVDSVSVSTSSPYTFVAVHSNHTISVTFASSTPLYSLTYIANSNGTISGVSPQTVASGGSGAAVQANPATGYHFVNWSDSLTANPRTDTNVTHNISVTANFAINTYTIFASAGSNGMVTPSATTTKNYGSSQSYTIATSTAGYHASNILVDGTPIGTSSLTYTFTNIQANHTISATFRANGSAPATYTIGGSISGLSGTVVLQNNGKDNLSRSANGSFTFVTATTTGNAYSVTVLTQPTGQTCTVSSGSGTVPGANVTTVSVTCTTNTCASLSNASTYNAYPTCGAATCASGYTLSGSGSSATCIAQSSSGGGGGSTPVDTTAPGIPTNFSASSTSTIVMLFWTNPIDSDFAGVKLYRKTGTALTSQTDTSAILIYQGKSTSFTDTSGKVAGALYYYSIYAYDARPNYSQPRTISFALPMPAGTPSATASTTIPITNTPTTSGGNNNPASGTVTTLIGASGITVNAVTSDEAQNLIAGAGFAPLNAAEINVYKKITALSATALSDANKFLIADFIHYGTPTTMSLGSGERGGSIASFQSAFNRLPSSNLDWQDVVKIGNGRWTTQRSAIAEARAKISFKKIYLRAPNMANARDNAAVNVMAYGLRPAARDMNSEKAAINSFKYIFHKNPGSAGEWDIVRSIAYSGAKR